MQDQQQALIQQLKTVSDFLLLPTPCLRPSNLKGVEKTIGPKLYRMFITDPSVTIQVR